MNNKALETRAKNFLNKILLRRYKKTELQEMNYEQFSSICRELSDSKDINYGLGPISINIMWEMISEREKDAER